MQALTFELDLGNLIVRRKEKSMFNFLVTAEGGLTTAGYAVSVIAVLILIILVAVLLQKNTSALKFTTQQLVTCAVASVSYTHLLSDEFSDVGYGWTGLS